MVHGPAPFHPARMPPSRTRRTLLRLTAAAAAGMALPAAAQPAAAKRAPGNDAPPGSPADDMMHGQGLLERVLLVYEESSRRMAAGDAPVPPEIIRDAAQIVRGYFEDHHQKLEEKYVFPRFERSTTREHADLVQVLREQHEAGRRLTDRILKLAETKLDDPVGRAQVQASLRDTVRMLRPHESREDSVLLPAFRKLVTAAEYRDLAAEMRKSDARTPTGSLDMMVEKVSALERQLDVYDLAKFTPKA
jgi:hemerythrin-like domain-containing protein